METYLNVCQVYKIMQSSVSLVFNLIVALLKCCLLQSGRGTVNESKLFLANSGAFTLLSNKLNFSLRVYSYEINRNVMLIEDSAFFSPCFSETPET